MLQLWLAPLSQLITGDLPLKHEVATQVRNSLLRTVARNFLDSGLFPAKYPYNRYVPTPVDAEVFFPGIVKYVERTREQLATFNGSSLGDPKVSPFIKMDAIAKALEFTGKHTHTGWLVFPLSLSLSPFPSRHHVLVWRHWLEPLSSGSDVHNSSCLQSSAI